LFKYSIQYFDSDADQFITPTKCFLCIKNYEDNVRRRFYFRVAHSCKIAREHQFYLHLQISLTEIDAVSFIVVDCGYSTEIALQVSEVVFCGVYSSQI
uniref:C2 tensin-type domain-containing protein n=1 Tax=Brugia pahangi TaxID=6280 RepID=A0A0N4T9V8_BRUPA